MKVQKVQFRGNGDLVPGYLARPETEGVYPGVVVIQEWWGLNDHIQDVTRRVAAAGYVAIAPDLYRGQVAAEPDDARKLAMELDRPHAIQDIQGAVNYLIAQPFVEPKQVGVMGFCMGGGLAAAMSYQGANVGAVVIFYGGGSPLTAEQASQVTAPILGLYGEEDHGIPLETIRANEANLKAHNKNCEFVIYPGAPHAFFNDERASYRPDAAADAWERTLGWFTRYLKTEG